MNGSVLAALGIASAVFNMAGLLPYARDVFRRRTKPERATWWVWFAISIVALFAQLASGARWSVLLTISTAIDVGIIAVLSIPFGYGKFHRRDTISLIVAGAGIIVSLLLRSPLLAVVTVVGVDLAGAWLTVIKAWAAPHTETLAAWELSTIAAVCGLLAVGDFHPARFLYPLYSLIANALVAYTIIFRRPKVAHDPADI